VFENLKNLKNKAAELAETHADAIEGGLEKVGDFIDDKTSHKYGDKIEAGVGKAQGLIERLGESKGEAEGEAKAEGAGDGKDKPSH